MGHGFPFCPHRRTPPQRSCESALLTGGLLIVLLQEADWRLRDEFESNLAIGSFKT